ncbi:MAG: hypothetical protein ACOY94_20015 [Bacillota bacterium]
MRIRSLAFVFVALVSLVGCTPIGNGPRVSERKAIALVKANSPLVQHSETQTTPPGPVWWVIYGRDKEDRPLAVWVSDQVEGYTFLDEGISRAEAVNLAKAVGYGEVAPNPVLVNPTQPTWAVTVKVRPDYWATLRVDKATGEVTQPPAEP